MIELYYRTMPNGHKITMFLEFEAIRERLATPRACQVAKEINVARISPKHPEASLWAETPRP